MDQEQWQEFQSLTAATAQRLDDGDWVLRLSVRPSFDDWRMLGVRRLKRRDEVVGRHWRRSEDAEKFRTPVERMRWPRGLTPTVDERSTLTGDGLVDELLASLGGVVVSVAPASGMVMLDGVEYSVYVRGDAMIVANLHWWCDHPAAWRPLMMWFGETWRKLDALLESDGAGPMAFAWERAG